ncbi:DNA cross-link repair protein PSO2/SNM1 [Elasticomyces elasticus]|nr:DNA cross-link repair protein PSO2/SNM1 [Elasticomyces elasticus]KAK4985545.1 DNA cross-link repair protein PSO2/SNM1 [Elasticomyces elasticus]
MFRNPRENAIASSGLGPLKPSVGRPPSPPGTPNKTASIATQPIPTPTPTAGMATRTLSSRTTPAKTNVLPKIGRGSTNPRKTTTPVNGKSKAQPNGSILSFFKKAETAEPSLFISDGSAAPVTVERETSLSEKDPYESAADDNPAIALGCAAASLGNDETRYQEDGGSVKRRKTNGDFSGPVSPKDSTASGQTQVDAQILNGGAASLSDDQRTRPAVTPSGSNVPKRSGPFLEESDSEDEEPVTTMPSFLPTSEDAFIGEELSPESTIPIIEEEESTEIQKLVGVDRPLLKREGTSYNGADGFADFEGIEDFEDDEFPDDGEEFLERRWMQEQRRLETAESGSEGEPDDGEEAMPSDHVEEEPDDTVERSKIVPGCPICNASFEGVSDADASVHVNHCLDGNPTPLPKREASSTLTPAVKSEGEKSASRFRRPVRPAKPGQENPFTLGTPNPNGGSAFSKLMSGHAEDAAWATAAAAENMSRGKPAYQRTCPFYKILPGLFICVDAFRYGAVEGCQAYFLSHFHSDHYIGLTSSWCHGPIYCSHVTANLVRQQLRVDPKWVVDLEFEKKVEVPGTKGVHVTMIPANHCPGSSLYLFEKVIGKGQNPKMQRILHCGDFRACKAHVEHPLLRPDVLDIATGHERQQKIDVCYLDTTYLNPKYAFPCQEDVIKACADMCVSLNKVQADESDGWEQMKRERAGAGMVKFVKPEPNPEIKQEIKEEDDEDVNAMKLSPASKVKRRGRLLVIVGTYSIGKERICMGIARALDSKIYAPPGKQRICAALEDPELNARLTRDPREAQVHMTPLFEIRADTLDDYLKDYKDHFSRAVGFRPSGWNYRPPNSRFTESPAVQTVLYSDNWKSTYGMRDLVPQRGSTSRASCFGVPYSEHSSFRELTMFCCALRIEKIIPTVNVGSAKSRERMKGWCEKWAVEKRKGGLFKLGDGKW